MTHINIKKINNYYEGCWQLRVYEPILISNIKIIENEKNIY